MSKGIYPIDDFNLPNLDKDDEATRPNLKFLDKKDKDIKNEKKIDKKRNKKINKN